MAHESFEDDDTAQMMNALYINIKVDREERPDVDDIYMQAVQAMTQHGGWPMTVFMFPDGRPFYGGTYYPNTSRHGMPSFMQVLQAVHDAYVNKRDVLEEQANNLHKALSRDVLGIGRDDDSGLTADMLTDAARKIMEGFDKDNGGFGHAPKFPQPMSLEFLLRYYDRTGDGDALHVVTHTLKKMAMGGIYDQIGGGFARYSVDAIWLVPHFEKMLYDNSQLSRVFLHTYQVTGDVFFRDIAVEIYDYILREMTAPEGGFYSTTDADSEGEEGKFFVWTIDEVKEALAPIEDDVPEASTIAIEYFGMLSNGNFEGSNILNIPNPEHLVAQRLGMTLDALREAVVAIKDRLYAVRTSRVYPGLDDKILTAWNGMMLASLAEAGRVLQREDYLVAAERAGDFLLAAMVDDKGRLYRTHKDGHSKLNGYLEDYANMIDALLELYQSTFMEKWFAEARRLADVVLAHYQADDGGFYDTSDDHEALITRPRNLQDNAVPSGNAMMAKQLMRLAAYTGDEAYDTAGRAVLRALTDAMAQYPSAFAESLNATDMLVNGLAEVAIVANPTDAETKAVLDTLRRPYRPNVVTALVRGNQDEHALIPLLSYRVQREDKPTVYVCRNFVCQMPVTSADDMRELLNNS
jgi:uncharacterized protein YyaL (SSP411 family)